MRILLIDNNDSFTRNLEHLLVNAIPESGVDVLPYALLPVRFDETDLIVISPGPGAPLDYPGYERVIDSGVPVLGVCLGMQIINAHLGGTISRLPDCVHGKTDIISFLGRTMTVARYHSLYCSSIGAGLEILAANKANVPMILGHKTKPIMGFQFHPESFLTCDGVFFIHDALRRILRV